MRSHQSIIKPKRPKGKGWEKLPDPPPAVTLGYPGESWYYPDGDLLVISAVEAPYDTGEPEAIPSYHVSISKNRQRCTSNEAKFVLRQFGITEAEEDNHVPHGIARHFWRPIADSLVGRECPCKESEPVIKEDKGDYIWRPAP